MSIMKNLLCLSKTLDQSKEFREVLDMCSVRQFYYCVSFLTCGTCVCVSYVVYVCVSMYLPIKPHIKSVTQGQFLRFELRVFFLLNRLP